MKTSAQRAAAVKRKMTKRMPQRRDNAGAVCNSVMGMLFCFAEGGQPGNLVARKFLKNQGLAERF